MKLVNVATRPSSVLILLSIAYAIVAVPQGRRLETLAMAALTSLGVGELITTLVNLIRRTSVNTWRTTALFSAAGFAGGASYVTEYSTIVFVASMLLLVAGAVAARNAGVTSPDPH